MKDIVVISTSPGRENWVKEMLCSISRPVVVVSDFGYELGKIKWVFENTNCDRFLFLQDSLVIRDESLFEQVFEAKGSSCIMDTPSCLGSYMGVYERSVLSKIDIPVIHTKEDSIYFEIEWTQRYIELCESFSHPISIVHKELETVRKFGRENLLYVNQYYEKWKGDWGVPVSNYEVIVNPVGLERVNLQMLEKSRSIQSLTKENELLKRTIELDNSHKEEIATLNHSHKEEIATLKDELSAKDFKILALTESTIWKLFRPYRKVLEILRVKKL
jgi:hypothetical protein